MVGVAVKPRRRARPRPLARSLIPAATLFLVAICLIFQLRYLGVFLSESEHAPTLVLGVPQNNVTNDTYPPQPPRTPFLPAWLRAYAEFHSDQLKNHQDTARFLVYVCSGGLCGGLGDRLTGMVTAFYLAVATNRVFLVHNPSPIDLGTVLNISMIDWRTHAGNVMSQKLLSIRMIDRVGNSIQLLANNAEHRYAAIRTNLNLIDQHYIFSRKEFAPSLRAQGIPIDMWLPPNGGILFAWAWAALFKPTPALEEAVRMKWARAEGRGGIAGSMLPGHGQYVAVHIRTGGHWGDGRRHDPANSEFTECVKRVAGRLAGAALSVYVASDDHDAKVTLKQGVPGALFDSASPYHIDKSGRGLDARERILETWAEFIIISRADCIVYSRSGFSEFAVSMSRDTVTGRRCAVQFDSCSVEDIDRSRSEFVPLRLYWPKNEVENTQTPHAIAGVMSRHNQTDYDCPDNERHQSSSNQQHGMVSNKSDSQNNYCNFKGFVKHKWNPKDSQQHQWKAFTVVQSTVRDKPSGFAARCDWVIGIRWQTHNIYGDFDTMPRTVFVNVANLSKFREYILPCIPVDHKFVMIIGDEDVTFPRQIDVRYQGYTFPPENWEELLADPRVAHIFGSHLDVDDAPADRVTPIPLGFNAKEIAGKNPDTALPLQARAMANVTDRPLKILFTNRVRDDGKGQWADRGHAAKLCSKLEHCDEKHPSGPKFLGEVAKYPFVLSVHGGGIDPNPNLFMTLLGGSIPIIARFPSSYMYDGWPVVVTDGDWNATSPYFSKDFLEAKRRELAPWFAERVKRQLVLDRLGSKYWWAKVQKRLDRASCEGR